MTSQTEGRVLLATRGLITVMIWLTIIASVVLAGACVFLPPFWDEVLRKFAGEHPLLTTPALLPSLLAIFALLIVTLGLIGTMLRKLRDLVKTVSEGDPFVRANAARLRMIGWLMTGVYIVGFPLAIMAARTELLFGGKPHGGVPLSLPNLLGILLTFVLAQVFERGAAMREDLEGTV